MLNNAKMQMVMTRLMILVLSFAFANMPIMLVILLFYRTRRDKYGGRVGLRRRKMGSRRFWGKSPFYTFIWRLMRSVLLNSK
jgi:hypothetical protein